MAQADACAWMGGEYDSRSHNIIWEGRFDAYIITITQEHHNADVEEEHIKIEKNSAATPDPSMIVAFPKKEIAQTLNKPRIVIRN